MMRHAFDAVVARVWLWADDNKPDGTLYGYRRPVSDWLFARAWAHRAFHRWAGPGRG